ncbi:MAG: hypothetical protein R3C01_13170 [Planctomycetaceae bacterium]
MDFRSIGRQLCMAAIPRQSMSACEAMIDQNAIVYLRPRLNTGHAWNWPDLYPASAGYFRDEESQKTFKNRCSVS